MIRTCAPLTGCWFDLSVTWPATLPCWAALARATPTSNAPNPRNASSVRRLELCIDPLFEGALERMTQESRPRRGLAAGRISCCDDRMPHPCPTAWANTNGAMWHARYILERALHMGIIVRRELETRKSLTQARFREIRARVGRFCQETVMTVLFRVRRRTGEANVGQTSGEGGAIRALPGWGAMADGRRYPTAAPDVEIAGAGQGHEGRGADHQEQQATTLRETAQVDSGDRAVRQGHRLPAPRQLISATQSDRLDRQRHCLLPVVQQPAADDAGVRAQLATDLRAPRLSQRRRDIRAGQWGRGGQRDVAVAAEEQWAERDSEARAHLLTTPPPPGPGTEPPRSPPLKMSHAATEPPKSAAPR